MTAGQSDLQAPLRDLVSRQSFAALLPHAGSNGGLIQRDALIQEISRVYHPDVLIFIEEVLNGFLDSKGGIAVSLSQSISIQGSSPNYQSSQQDGPDPKLNAKAINVSKDKLLSMGSPALRSARSVNPLKGTSKFTRFASSDHHKKMPFGIVAADHKCSSNAILSAN
ncbi:hypothetical protein [Cyanobium sp. WKJ7-Wakatipu]|uniref:hypothetical protein n=1 Tax=Cyanobium sp. WKJ7-Wakatipu TaxID=2823726 RepID=UPI0020CD9F1A|nr:hypothetical protein [Cyanobium sp. WKJ7-Wakatipu]